MAESKKRRAHSDGFKPAAAAGGLDLVALICVNRMLNVNALRCSDGSGRSGDRDRSRQLDLKTLAARGSHVAAKIEANGGRSVIAEA